MPDLDPVVARGEAERRIRKALEHVQRAQAELGRACEELSNIAPEPAARRELGKLYDRVHAAWYRVEAFRKSGRFDLDGIARETLARSLAAQEDPRV